MGRRGWTAALAASLSLAVVGCGGDDDGGTEPGGPDPASVVPPQALVYAEATVRPEGDQRDELETQLSAVLGVDDVGAEIREQVDSLLADTNLTYEQDVQPWLGDRAGLYLLNLTDESDGAFVVPTTDEAAAQAALDKVAESEGVSEEQTTDGVPYVVTEDDSALGIVGDFAVLGSERGFDEVLATSRGESLAESDAFAEATGDLGDNGLVTAYADPAGVLSALVGARVISGAQSDEIADSLAGVFEGPGVLTAGADDAGFFAELASEGGDLVGGGTNLIERVPDDAWLAFGLANAGSVVGPALVGALSSNDVLGGVLERIQTQEGVDLGSFAASVGDVAGWFGGPNVLAARGALLFESGDEAVATELLDGLGSAFSADPAVKVTPGEVEGEAFSAGPADVPVEFPFVLRDGLLVAGLGEQSIEQAYQPETSLADSDAYEAAEEALGDGFDVGLLIDFQTLVGFFEGLNTEDEPDLNSALPYMARLDVFAAGARDDDGSTTLRFILRPQSGD